MALSAIYDKLEEVPEHFHELYTEKNGKYELTGIEGVKTQGDIDRIQTALSKERGEHKTAREALKMWEGLKYEEVRAQLDEYPELKAKAENAKGGDPAVIEATVKARLAPVERDLLKTREENAALAKANESFKLREEQRAIHDEVRAARMKAKAREDAEDDILLNADRMFEVVVDAEGKQRVLTRDGVGVTPGVSAEVWLSEMAQKRAYWWPEPAGGGARGTQGGGTTFAKNPFSAAHWNYTEQVKAINADRGKAEQMAKSAGTTIGGPKPAK